MPQITFDIPADKIDIIVEAMQGIYPIPKVLSDPQDPDSGSVPEFTPNEWAKERVRRFIIDTVHRYQVKQARDAARDGISADDDIAS